MKKLQAGALKADGSAYTPEEIKAHNDFVELVETQVKELTADMISKEDADKAIEDAVKGATEPLKKDIEKHYQTLLKQGTVIAKMGMNKTPATGKEAIKAEVEANKADLKAIANGVSDKEVVVKATTTRASIATTNEALFLDGIGQLARIRRSLYNFATKIPVSSSNNQGIIHYVDWDEDTVSKAAAMRAENTTFPESTAKFKGYTLPLRKVGDTLPVTEEFFEDEEMCAAELETFLLNNVDAVIDDQIINGDNTGQNLKGLKASVAEFSAPSGTIVDPNIYDLITKMRTAITSTGGSKYDPNFAVMNKSTIDRLILKKDANGQYLFPTNHPIYAFIIEDNNVDDNELVVGDSRYMKIYEKPGVVLSKGEPANNFLDDIKTLKARKRLLLLIRAADASGFKKCTDIDAALATMTAVVTP